MEDFYISVDIGGTDIKAGFVSAGGKILCSKKIKTHSSEPNLLASRIINVIDALETESGLKSSLSKGIGVGIPGLLDSKNGVSKFSGNLKLRDYPIKEPLESRFKLPIKIANDADVATLSELYYGAGKGKNSLIFVTIGTGIGGGVVLNGRLLTETNEFAGEIGHMKTTDKKVKCTCGEYGCYEAVASTKALVSQTKLAMKKHPESLMWQKYNLETVSGKTVFEFKDKDNIAKTVFDNFIQNLGDGLVNLTNIFMPEVIILSGAISNQKNALLEPLQKYVNKHIYAGKIGKTIEIKIAENTANAGVLGARCLFFN